jgi:hypothetical protein
VWWICGGDGGVSGRLEDRSRGVEVVVIASLSWSREKLLMVSLGEEWRGERPARESAKSREPKVTITKTATLVSKIISFDFMSDN